MNQHLEQKRFYKKTGVGLLGHGLDIFETYESRGGGTPEEAFDAWFKEIAKRYPKHSFRMKIDDHPKFIINKLKNIEEEHFGYNAFNLKIHKI